MQESSDPVYRNNIIDSLNHVSLVAFDQVHIRELSARQVNTSTTFSTTSCEQTINQSINHSFNGKSSPSFEHIFALQTI